MKDENFRKVLAHVMDKHGVPSPCTCYQYETRARLYMVYVLENGRKRCWVRGCWSAPLAIHHKICTHYNLGALDESSVAKT